VTTTTNVYKLSLRHLLKHFLAGLILHVGSHPSVSLTLIRFNAALLRM
jgi:hypothetical protein